MVNDCFVVFFPSICFSADFTMYPFSTQNKQDFSNLMSVYLDATLHPKLDRMDFLQEGNKDVDFEKMDSMCHKMLKAVFVLGFNVSCSLFFIFCFLFLFFIFVFLFFLPIAQKVAKRYLSKGHRLEWDGKQLTRTGIVFNEMHGALSDSSSLFREQISCSLYPTTTYGKNR